MSVGSGENQDDIELVRNLVKEHIEKSNCIILLTVTCESKRFVSPRSLIAQAHAICMYAADFENQGAYTLTRECDPKGKRTIGTAFACHYIVLFPQVEL